MIDGDPSTCVGDFRRVEMDFSHGAGYDPERLAASVRTPVGLFS